MFTQDYSLLAQRARSLLSELLEDSRHYRSGQDYQETLDFVVRLRNFAPFNAVWRDLLASCNTCFGPYLTWYIYKAVLIVATESPKKVLTCPNSDNVQSVLKHDLSS